MTVGIRPSRKSTLWRRALACGVVVAFAGMTAPAQAGFFDFLFGDSHDQPSQAPQSYAEPPPALGRIAPAPLGPESVRQGSAGTGRVVAYCVRLCDGHGFPLGRTANLTPVEACRSMCPASKTKVFFGNEIGSAVAKDGERYAALDTAFTYRQQLVPNCTCNGRNAFGLAPFDLSNDPTLRPGDIVSTKEGLMTFTGRNGKAAAFTPVDPSSIETELNSVTVGVAAKGPAHNEEASAESTATMVGGRLRGQISQ